MTAIYTPVISYTHPAWAKDYGNREHVLAGGATIDPTQFPRDDSVLVTLSAEAAAGATSLSVASLSGKVPANTVLRFNGGQFAVTTADTAASGTATTIPVEALAFTIPNGSVASYMGTGRVTIKDGTVVGRTLAERDAGTPFGPAADGDAVVGTGEVYFVLYTVDDALRNRDVTLYRHGSLVAENFVPGWAGISATIKTYLRTVYQCTRGAD